MDPDPVAKVRAELKALGADAGQTTRALAIVAQTEAAEKYKNNAEGLKAWQRELDETAAKIRAMQAGADPKIAEQWAKLATDDDGQRDQFAALAQRQQAEDAALKTLEQQRKVTEDITTLQREAAQVGMSEAAKKLDDLKRDGAKAGQIAQAQQLQQQIESQQKAAEQTKKNQEEAKRLVEQSLTPLEKFQKTTADINGLLLQGLLTDQQAEAAMTKAGKELAGSQKDENKHARAETRRFDFSLPKEPKHADPASQQLQVARQQLESTKQAEYFLQQLYNFGQADQQNQDVVVDI